MVQAVAEGQVRVLRAGQVEPPGVLEDRLVEVARGQGDQDGFARAHEGAPDVDVLGEGHMAGKGV